MSALQRADYLRPFIGKWLTVRGRVLASSDNRPLGGFGVTVIVPDPTSAIDVFCAFYGDYDRLALVTAQDEVAVEGILTEVRGGDMKMDSCLLLNTMDGSRVHEVVTRDQHLRSFLNSIPETDTGVVPAISEIDGLRVEQVAFALHKAEIAVSISSGLTGVRAQIERLGLTNFEASSAQSYVNIMIEVAKMPEPDVSIFWLALERASHIAGVASLIVSVIALKYAAS